MKIEALLLTRDFHLQRTVERTLDAFAMGVEHHTDGQKALQRVAEWKFAAVIADCDHDQGLALLEATRLEPRNKNGIAIAAVRAGLGVRVPFRSGANFVLEKPVTRERAARLVRAAYGLIAREHFRYLRHALDVPVRTLFPDGQSMQIQSRNVSARGLGLQFSSLSGRLPSVRVRFKLPEATSLVEAHGEVVWTDEYGRAGVRLLNLPPASQRVVEKWLAARNEFLTSDSLRPTLPPRADTISSGYANAIYPGAMRQVAGGD